jgi:hypothetical protein
MKESFASLVRASPEAVLRAASLGREPDPSDLAGWELRGWYVPGSVPSLLARKHCKGFYTSRGRLAGYNVPCHPGGPGEPWVDRLRGPGALRCAWFVAHPAEGHLELDYSRDGAAGRLDPLRLVRERLVEVAPGLLVSTVLVRIGGSVREAGLGVYERHRRSPLGI